jgi:hypothetical protein
MDIKYKRDSIGTPFLFLDIIASHQTISDFVILLDSVFQFNLPVFKDSAFEIRIYNGDNPPLMVDSVATAQELKKQLLISKPAHTTHRN